jgi:hypothetical protein
VLITWLGLELALDPLVTLAPRYAALLLGSAGAIVGFAVLAFFAAVSARSSKRPRFTVGEQGMITAGLFGLFAAVGYGAAFLKVSTDLRATIGTEIGIRGPDRTQAGGSLIVVATMTIEDCDSPVKLTITTFVRKSRRPSLSSGDARFAIDPTLRIRALKEHERYPGDPAAIPPPRVGRLVLGPPEILSVSEDAPPHGPAAEATLPDWYKRRRPVQLESMADWLTRRSRAGCEVIVPYFVDAARDPGGPSLVPPDAVLDSWVTVYTSESLEIDTERSRPVNVLADRSGLYRCDSRRFPDSCGVYVVLEDANAAQKRDLALLLLGVVTSLAAALLLEGLLGPVRRLTPPDNAASRHQRQT